MLHRREGHKAVCALHATWPSQNLRESPDEGEQTDKLSRWVKAWTPVVSTCLPIALDLANHEWGRHETHT